MTCLAPAVSIAPTPPDAAWPEGRRQCGSRYRAAALRVRLAERMQQEKGVPAHTRLDLPSTTTNNTTNTPTTEA